MEIKTISFDYREVKKANSEKRKKFCNDIDVENCVYLFFGKSKCYYIGETGDSLKKRCFTNTPKHITREWFDNCDQVIIIKLDNELGDIERRALEATFILSYKSAGHPLANKK